MSKGGRAERGEASEPGNGKSRESTSPSEQQELRAGRSGPRQGRRNLDHEEFIQGPSWRRSADGCVEGQQPEGT